MNGTLIPRKYAITSDDCDYVWYAEWLLTEHGPKWALLFGVTRNYLTTKGHYDFLGHDTAYFDTAEEALEYWKDYRAKQ